MAHFDRIRCLDLCRVIERGNVMVTLMMMVDFRLAPQMTGPSAAT